MVYKGLVLATQRGAYFQDLNDPRVESALVLVHQLFSTDTFPAPQWAHPYRMVAHNGEINTLRGNVNRMAAGEASVDFGDYQAMGDLAQCAGGRLIEQAHVLKTRIEIAFSDAGCANSNFFDIQPCRSETGSNFTHFSEFGPERMANIKGVTKFSGSDILYGLAANGAGYAGRSSSFEQDAMRIRIDERRETDLRFA